jgi:hypothetical protein
MLTLGGCGAHINGWDNLTAGQPRIDDSVWFRVPGHAQMSNQDQDTFIPRSCDNARDYPVQPDHAAADPTKPLYFSGDVITPKDISGCVNDMKVVIDRRFEHWIDALASWTNISNSLVDTTIIGAGLAGTLAGGLTSQILNAVSSGLTGTKKSFDQDVFLQQSVSIIVTQMKTDRAKWDTIIEGRLLATTAGSTGGTNPPAKVSPGAPSSASTSTTTADGKTTTTTKSTTAAATPARPYATLGEAWGDLENYSRQGSFNNALTTLTANVSAQSAACQAEKLNVRQASTAPASTSKSTPSAATATSECPAATPAGSVTPH